MIDDVALAVNQAYQHEMRDAAVAAERDRCARIVKRAMRGRIDRDLRTILELIEKPALSATERTDNGKI